MNCWSGGYRQCTAHARLNCTAWQIILTVPLPQRRRGGGAPWGRGGAGKADLQSSPDFALPSKSLTVRRLASEQRANPIVAGLSVLEGLTGGRLRLCFGGIAAGAAGPLSPSGSPVARSLQQHQPQVALEHPFLGYGRKGVESPPPLAIQESGRQGSADLWPLATKGKMEKENSSDGGGTEKDNK